MSPLIHFTKTMRAFPIFSPRQFYFFSPFLEIFFSYFFSRTGCKMKFGKKTFSIPASSLQPEVMSPSKCDTVKAPLYIEFRHFSKLLKNWKFPNRKGESSINRSYFQKYLSMFIRRRDSLV